MSRHYFPPDIKQSSDEDNDRRSLPADVSRDGDEEDEDVSMVSLASTTRQDDVESSSSVVPGNQDYWEAFQLQERARNTTALMKRPTISRATRQPAPKEQIIVDVPITRPGAGASSSRPPAPISTVRRPMKAINPDIEIPYNRLPDIPSKPITPTGVKQSSSWENVPRGTRAFLSGINPITVTALAAVTLLTTLCFLIFVGIDVKWHNNPSLTQSELNEIHQNIDASVTNSTQYLLAEIAALRAQLNGQQHQLMTLEHNVTEIVEVIEEIEGEGSPPSLAALQSQLASLQMALNQDYSNFIEANSTESVIIEFIEQTIMTLQMQQRGLASQLALLNSTKVSDNQITAILQQFQASMIFTSAQISQIFQNLTVLVQFQAYISELQNVTAASAEQDVFYLLFNGTTVPPHFTLAEYNQLVINVANFQSSATNNLIWLNDTINTYVLPDGLNINGTVFPSLGNAVVTLNNLIYAQQAMSQQLAKLLGLPLLVSLGANATDYLQKELYALNTTLFYQLGVLESMFVPSSTITTLSYELTQLKLRQDILYEQYNLTLVALGYIQRNEQYVMNNITLFADFINTLDVNLTALYPSLTSVFQFIESNPGSPSSPSVSYFILALITGISNGLNAQLVQIEAVSDTLATLAPYSTVISMNNTLNGLITNFNWLENGLESMIQSVINSNLIYVNTTVTSNELQIISLIETTITNNLMEVNETVYGLKASLNLTQSQLQSLIGLVSVLDYWMEYSVNPALALLPGIQQNITLVNQLLSQFINNTLPSLLTTYYTTNILPVIQSINVTLGLSQLNGLLVVTNTSIWNEFALVFNAIGTAESNATASAVASAVSLYNQLLSWQMGNDTQLYSLASQLSSNYSQLASTLAGVQSNLTALAMNLNTFELITIANVTALQNLINPFILLTIKNVTALQAQLSSLTGLYNAFVLQTIGNVTTLQATMNTIVTSSLPLLSGGINLLTIELAGNATFLTNLNATVGTLAGYVAGNATLLQNLINNLANNSYQFASITSVQQINATLNSLLANLTANTYNFAYESTVSTIITNLNNDLYQFAYLSNLTTWNNTVYLYIAQVVNTFNTNLGNLQSLLQGNENSIGITNLTNSINALTMTVTTNQNLNNLYFSWMFANNTLFNQSIVNLQSSVNSILATYVNQTGLLYTLLGYTTLTYVTNQLALYTTTTNLETYINGLNFFATDTALTNDITLVDTWLTNNITLINKNLSSTGNDLLGIYDQLTTINTLTIPAINTEIGQLNFVIIGLQGNFTALNASLQTLGLTVTNNYIQLSNYIQGNYSVIQLNLTAVWNLLNLFVYGYPVNSTANVYVLNALAGLQTSITSVNSSLVTTQAKVSDLSITIANLTSTIAANNATLTNNIAILSQMITTDYGNLVSQYTLIVTWLTNNITAVLYQINITNYNVYLINITVNSLLTSYTITEDALYQLENNFTYAIAQPAIAAIQAEIVAVNSTIMSTITGNVALYNMIQGVVSTVTSLQNASSAITSLQGISDQYWEWYFNQLTTFTPFIQYGPSYAGNTNYKFGNEGTGNENTGAVVCFGNSISNTRTINTTTSYSNYVAWGSGTNDCTLINNAGVDLILDVGYFTVVNGNSPTAGTFNGESYEGEEVYFGVITVGIYVYASGTYTLTSTGISIGTTYSAVYGLNLQSLTDSQMSWNFNHGSSNVYLPAGSAMQLNIYSLIVAPGGGSLGLLGF